MIARLCGVALDARAATRTLDPVELAIASRWIAANVVSIRRARIVIEGEVPIGAHVIGAQVTSLNELLAVLASVPALVDGATLPLRWRVALRALGVPVLDHALGAVLGGASVVAVTKRASDVQVVRTDDGCYRVRLRINDVRRALAA